MQSYRQGDVLLVPVAAVPEGAKEVAHKGDVVLKWGEVTNHAHRITADPTKVRVWSAGVERFLQVLAPVSLTHEEHGAIDLAPGVYHVPAQVEWTDENEPRAVAD